MKDTVTPSSQPLLLVLLLGDERKPNLAACMMLATWVNVKDYTGEPREVAERWSRVSGVRADDVVTLWGRLVGNGFVTMDGQVDPVAINYASQVLATWMPKRARQAAPTLPKHTESEGI